jgi:hypothetical protein
MLNDRSCKIWTNVLINLVNFKENEVAGSPPYVMAKTGIAYMPDDLRIFPDNHLILFRTKHMMRTGKACHGFRII